MAFWNKFFNNTQSGKGGSEVLEVQAYREALSQSNGILVDVRTPREYGQGHIANALNIDFFDRVAFDRSFRDFDRELPIFLYCRSGARSQKAAKRLAGMGFSKIYDLKGGYIRWRTSE